KSEYALVRLLALVKHTRCHGTPSDLPMAEERGGDQGCRASLRGLAHRRAAGAELFEQRRLLGLGGGEVARLDVTEAAAFLRDVGEAHGEVMVLGRQRG